MKSHIHVLVLLAISATMLIVGASNSLVLAQPCNAALSYPIVSAAYSYSNIPITVPVSVSCTTSYGNELYATGSAYDATTNTGLGSTSALLTASNGGMEFDGQLGFNLPLTTQGHSIQISVSIYTSQDGDLITQASETVVLGGPTGPTGFQQVTTTTVTVGQYPYANPYSYPYSNPYPYPSSPSSYPSQFYPPYQPNSSEFQFHQGHQAHYQSQAFGQSQYNTTLFDYVVIIAIIATVIIATAGLVLVARRQPVPVPVWPPPPR